MLKTHKRQLYILLSVLLLTGFSFCASKVYEADLIKYTILFKSPYAYEASSYGIYHRLRIDYTASVPTQKDIFYLYYSDKADAKWAEYWENTGKTGYISAWMASCDELPAEAIVYPNEILKFAVLKLGVPDDPAEAQKYHYEFKWIETPILYTVHYHANGGTSGSTDQSNHTYDTAQNLTSNGFVRPGYRFLGWSTDAAATSPTYTNGQSVLNLTTTHNAVLDLYAIWAPNNYTISFSENGGTSASAPKTITYDQTYGALPAPTRIGYTFQGWYTETAGGSKITADTKVTTPQNHTLYAQWEANPYKVTYHPNGGTTSAAATTCTYGTSVPLTPVAKKSGYTFVGWATSPNAQKPLTSFTMPDLATSPNPDYASDWELTLYALYSIDVSDVANHTYPSYDKQKQNEVFLMVWKESAPSSYQQYELTYTGDVGIMHYEYQLHNTDFFSYVGNEAYGYKILAYDNAGNYTVLYQGSSNGQTIEEPVIPVKYLQTIKHYFYDTALDKWTHFESTTHFIEEGQTFTPSYTTPPDGYQTDHIDGAYMVSSKHTTSAYYIPITYTLTFEPNGGSVSPSSKKIIYNDYYGDMPIPTKTGHRFLGWYADTNGKEKITDSMRYTLPNDSTVYAQWEANSYKVVYDYWTNGGTAVTKTTDSIVYGSKVDISVTATKEGWTFIGWNTNPDATTGLTDLKMNDDDLTLYAIYQKDISATFVDGMDMSSQTITQTIYNRETSCTVSIPGILKIHGWKSLGWSLSDKADGDIHASPNTNYELSENTVFYASYLQSITLSYDTNGSSETIPSQSGERFYNAFGTYKNPIFTTAAAPKLENHAFVAWVELDDEGNVSADYMEQQEIEVNRDLHLTAAWNQHPEIEAYDRYFTLEDALNGVITQEKLLEKVVATDKEDGVLVNGKDVIIPDFPQYNFSAPSDIVITYQATDSFGNIFTKDVMVHIVDTTVSQSPTQHEPRFIRLEFFKSGNSFVNESDGGLRETSTWRTSELHEKLLEHTLEKQEPVQSWHFSKNEIEHLKTSFDFD